MPTPPPETHPIRHAITAVWLVLVAGALSLYLFRRDLVEAALQSALAGSSVAAGLYLLIGGLRAVTLVPATVLLVAAIPFFDPWTLLGLTLVNIAVSSSICYFFAEALHLDEAFTRKYPEQILKITATLQRYELPIIVGWSFMLFLPTDLICYVCGSLKINFPKFLFGVVLGEGTVYAIYIFLGDYALGKL